MKKSLLITGANGWFGRVFAANINNLIKNYFDEVFFLVRNKPGPHLNQINKSNIKVIRQDLNQEIDLDINFTHCIHMATPEDGLAENIKSDLILLQTQNLFNFCRLKKVKKFLFLSSGAVYDEFSNRIKENEVDLIKQLSLKNLDGYQIGKIKAEIFLKDTNSEVNVIIARCFTFYGKEMPNHFAISKIISDILENKEITIMNNVTRSYLHENNLFEALKILLVSNCLNTTYNIGSNNDITLSELALKISDILNTTINISNKNLIANKRQYYVPDTSLFDNEFMPRYNDYFDMYIKTTYLKK